MALALGCLESTKDSSRRKKGGCRMRLVKRFAVAISSLLALVLAGGAHWRL